MPLAGQKQPHLQGYPDVCVFVGREAHWTITCSSMCPPRMCPAQAWHTKQAHEHLFMGTKYTEIIPHLVPMYWLVGYTQL